MSVRELACTYAALILHDDGIPITAEKISTLLKTANVSVESYWPSLFAKLCEKKNVEDLIHPALLQLPLVVPVSLLHPAQLQLPQLPLLSRTRRKKRRK